MSTQLAGQPTFWATVKLLLAAARKRSTGRQQRQQKLLQNRSDGKSTDWSGLGFAMTVLLMVFINGAAAFVLKQAVETAQRVEVERQGKIVVSEGFFNFVTTITQMPASTPDSSSDVDNSPAVRMLPLKPISRTPDLSEYKTEAKRISEKYGGSQPEIEKKLLTAVLDTGTIELVTEDRAAPGLKSLTRTGPLSAMFGSLILMWWVVMLAFQGEGLEMDTQRRRHPMWEWLFSHPVPPGAVFLAEMLSPIAANPVYWSGPLFAGFVYGIAYDPGVGFLAGFLVGFPVTVAAACLGKALEIGVILRLAPRSRGATIGLMSWLGYTSMMLFLVGLAFVPRFITGTASFFYFLTGLPWPWLGLFLGARADGSLSFPSGVLTCWVTAAIVVAASIWFSVWGTQKGLTGNFASDAPRASAANETPRFGKEPLYRKEMLWFIRDRSAIVQTILVPLSVAVLQVFNLRGVLIKAESAWNYLCGVAIFFGTYFLWVLGPKSLQSEGSALWIALTWPRGLESLLKAKAWLWSLISSGLVAIVLCYAAFSFRTEIWKIALVGVGWYFFARSMAEKSVTLVTITSSSGETEKVPMGRRWAAQLGMMTFAIGILSQQWQLAIVGIVYSFLTAAAMWQNFRARLPFLYDPWSEKLPQPPTLMHAMISISVLVELSALLSGILLALAGREHLASALAFSYGISAIVVSLFVSNFLREREVRPQDIWCWLPDDSRVEEGESWARRYGLADPSIISALLMAASGGLALGMFARGYVAVLSWLPITAEFMRKNQEQLASMPDFRFWYAIMAIGFAPFAEEYLFRGLLFRALDREWGGWRAVLGCVAFFAIYHPPMSWLPVGLLGAANCVLFKKTGRLAPAVLLHMVYNAVVLL